MKNKHDYLHQLYLFEISSILLKVISDLCVAYEMEIAPEKKLNIIEHLLFDGLDSKMEHLYELMLDNHLTIEKMASYKSISDNVNKMVYHKNMRFNFSLN